MYLVQISESKRVLVQYVTTYYVHKENWGKIDGLTQVPIYNINACVYHSMGELITNNILSGRAAPFQ